MKVTNFGPNGLPITLAGWSTGIVSLNSNVEIIGGGLAALNFVQRITSNTSNTLLNPIVNFASGSNIAFAVQSNTLTIIGAAGGGGAPTVISAGSNSTRVREVSTAGASTTLWSPYDHAHDGIGTITSSASNTMQRGTWNIRPGSGIALALTDTDGDGEFDTTTIINTGSSGGGGGGSSDAILGQVGIGGAIIPGLQGSADIRVNGASDDEFDTTDTSDPMTGWTTLGTPAAHDINSTVKSHYYVKTTTASVALMGIYKAKTVPFTVTCKMADYLYTATTSMRAGLFVSEAAPGALSSIAMSNSGVVLVTAWTNRTTFSSNPGTINVSVTPLYFQIVATSSTNVNYYVSLTGKVWTAVLTAHNPGFTVGAAGLLVNHGGVTTEAIFDWIRFT